MYFNSFVYVFAFLPIVFLLYSLTRTHVLNKYILICASLIFYGWREPWFIIPMLGSGVLDYFIARKIAETDDVTRRKRLLVSSIVAQLAVMSVFKYTGWITESIVALSAFAGLSIMTAPIHLPLPPGVSFYTFETISYTVDVYKKEFQPKRSLIDYLQFLVFFPHLVAGPIRRAKQLVPVLSAYRPGISAEVASRALFYILWGLVLKVVCADNMGAIVEYFDSQLSAKTPLAPGAGLIFTYAFCFQIYCDFSAYSLIARGSALLFGVEIDRNFLTPYFSSNPSEFWQRWHISLSTWLRDYLYIPLGGNQRGTLITLRNLLIVMVLGGLWHGAGVFFILWGLWHGLLLVVYRIAPIDDWFRKYGGRFGHVLSVMLFFHLVCFGWILFRTNPDTFGAVLTSIRDFSIYLIPFHSPAPISPIVSSMGWVLLLYAVPVAVADFIGYLNKCEFPELWTRFGTATRVGLILLAVYLIIFFGARQANEFIYFAF